jgi:hypothetical protein
MSAKKPPIMKAPEFIKKFEEMKLRYVIVSWAAETRRELKRVGEFEKWKNIAATPFVYPARDYNRFADYLNSAIEVLEPVFKGPMTAVYDGPSVLAVLRQQQKP